MGSGKGLPAGVPPWEREIGCSYTEWHEPVYPVPQLLVQTGLHRRLLSL